MKRLSIVPLAVVALLARVVVSRATLVCPNQSTVLSRPVPMGTSIGDVYEIAIINGKKFCGAGTAGAVAIDNNNNTVILTNNHIGAFNYSPWSNYDTYLIAPFPAGSNWTNPAPGYAFPVGDSRYCDMTAEAPYAIATEISGWQNTAFTQNTGDSAKGKVIPLKWSNNVLNIGVPQIYPYPYAPYIGMHLQFMGASSCYRTIQVVQTGVAFPYNDGSHTYEFNDTIYAASTDTSFGGPAQGDSGTVVFTEGTRPQAVGLFFANDRGYFVINPIAYIGAQENIKQFSGRTCTPTQIASHTSIANTSTPLPNSPTHEGVPGWHDTIKPDANGILPTTPPYMQDYLNSESPQQKAAMQAKDQLYKSLSAMTYRNGSPKIKSVGLTQDKKGNWIIVVGTLDPTPPEVLHAVPPSVNGFPVKIDARKQVGHHGQLEMR